MRQIVQRIGVVGGGVVGRATARAWLESAGEVRVHDRVPERSTHSLAEVLECDWIFVSLPTNYSAESGISMDAVWDFFGGELPRDRQFVLRSSVWPGTTDRLCEMGFQRVTHFPEFLTGRCADADAAMPSQLAVGYGIDHDGVEYKESHAAAGDLHAILKRRFPGSPSVVAPARATELAKISLNSFFAIKVLFFNHVYEACRKLGIPFETTQGIVLADGRVAPWHCTVPGRNGMGIGNPYEDISACLPKDTTALARLLDSLHLNNAIPKAAMEYNSEFCGLGE